MRAEAPSHPTSSPRPDRSIKSAGRASRLVPPISEDTLMKTVHIGYLLAAALAVSACQSGESNQSAPASPPSQGQATAASSSANDRLRAFIPPSDGRLVASQVEQYIAVRRRARQIAREGKTSASLVPFLVEIPQAEARAAGELGRDIAEYRWVQARIAEASTPSLPEGSADLLKAIEASGVKRAADIQKTAADQRRVPAPAATDAAAVSYNRDLLDPFRSELTAIEQP